MKKKRTRNIKRKKHDSIVDDYDKQDRKSTRLNSSHLVISYAVFCLKKKKKKTKTKIPDELKSKIGMSKERKNVNTQTSYKATSIHHGRDNHKLRSDSGRK